VFIDTIPVVAITAPATNATLQTGVATTVSGTASSLVSTIASVKLYLGDPSLGGTLLGTATGTNAWSFSYTPAASPGGTQSIFALATDLLGITNKTSVSVFIDTIPVVAITAPATNATLPAGVATNVTATITSAYSTITGANAYLGDPDLGGTLLGAMTNTVGNTWNYVYTPIDAQAGSKSIFVRATDGRSLTNKSSVAVTIITVQQYNINNIVAMGPTQFKVLTSAPGGYSAGVWNDLSGNGKNTSSLGNDPTASTDSGDQALLFASASTQRLSEPASVFPAIFTNATIYFVYRRTTTGASITLFSKDSNTWIGYYTSGNLIRMNLGSSANFVQASGADATTNIRLGCFWYDGTQGTAANRGDIYVDDMTTAVAKSTGGTIPASLSAATVFQLGSNTSGGNYFNGYMMAVVIFNGVSHNSTQRNQVKTYLSGILASI
jgi:hypothetical protein